MNIFSVLAIVLIACSKAGPPPMPADPCMVEGIDTCNQKRPLIASINLSAEKQTMHSFGASDCWGIKFIGKNWPEEKRNQIADLLFSKEVDAQGNPKGIGLSMWRINIGAGSFEQGDESQIASPWRREESFLLADDSYDFTKQAGNQWFAKAAKDRGVENFLLFSISPPVHMTKNGKAFAPGGEDLGKLNLKPGKMVAFADFLSETAKHYSNSGIPINYLSPLNEPQWDWTAGSNGLASQEGTPATNEEAVTLIKALDQQLTQKGLSTKIAAGEVAAVNYAFGPVANAAQRSDVFNYFWNPSSAGYIGSLPTVAPVLSAHSYFAQPDVSSLISNREQLAARMQSVNPSVGYWQSEYCILGAEDNIQGNGRDLGIQTALYIARIVHTDIVVGNASSWQWWLGVSPSDYKDGLVYVADNSGTMGELASTQQDGLVYPSKMLWAFGNYARFIRPGMIRVDASLEKNTDTRTAATNLMLSAYKNPTTKEFVLVLINMTIVEEEMNLSGIQLASDEVHVYTTSGTQELRHQVKSGSDPMIITPKSVITITGTYQ
ncbi:glycoside hydrolase [Flavihumibacter sp. UBA7668]|uniref:glycoside hydrolase n=1 Tax=Flavihumibacter sp. UBA7668 TaxID=1946542 RepID=UPI0025C42EA1|nr:glycoside hydrolase [Flavihumibacter sp. UBA7668]